MLRLVNYTVTLRCKNRRKFSMSALVSFPDLKSAAEYAEELLKFVGPGFDRAFVWEQDLESRDLGLILTHTITRD